jgi:hypothetical protein
LKRPGLLPPPVDTELGCEPVSPLRPLLETIDQL